MILKSYETHIVFNKKTNRLELATDDDLETAENSESTAAENQEYAILTLQDFNLEESNFQQLVNQCHKLDSLSDDMVLLSLTGIILNALQTPELTNGLIIKREYMPSPSKLTGLAVYPETNTIIRIYNGDNVPDSPVVLSLFGEKKRLRSTDKIFSLSVDVLLEMENATENIIMFITRVHEWIVASRK